MYWLALCVQKPWCDRALVFPSAASRIKGLVFEAIMTILGKSTAGKSMILKISSATTIQTA